MSDLGGMISRLFKPMPHDSLRAAYFIQMSNVLGAGILTLPVACRIVGIFGFLAMMFLSFLLAYTNWVVLGRVGHALRQKGLTLSWHNVVEHLFGDMGIFFFTVNMVIDCFGAVIYFIIISGQFLSDILPDFRQVSVIRPFLPGFILDLPNEIAVILIPMLFPTILSTFKNLSALRYIGTYSVGLIIAVCVIVTVKSPFEFFKRPAEDRIIDFMPHVGFKDALQAMSIVQFSFIGPWNFYNITEGMKNPHEFRRVKKVMFRSTLSQSIMYVIVGLAGYLSFFNDTQGNLLQNYGDKDHVVTILKCIFGIQLMSVMTFLVWPMRDGAQFIIRRELNLSEDHLASGTWSYYALGIFFLWMAVFCAIFCPSVTLVTSNIGSFIGASVSCLLPIMLYWKAVLQPRWQRNSSLREPFISGVGWPVPGSPGQQLRQGAAMTPKEIFELGLLSLGAVSGFTFFFSQFYYGFT